MEDETRGKAEELLAFRDELSYSNLEWARLTREIDPGGKGVHYQTIRRMERGETMPRAATIRKLEEGLRHAADRR